MKRCPTDRIRSANEEAVIRMMTAEPVLFDVKPALSVIPGMTSRMILHAGSPIAWTRMCSPMKIAVGGAIVFEKWAPDLESALHLANSGKIQFSPNHHHNTVGPMAGIISPSMNVLCVKNITSGNLAFCNLNEGLGRVLRFGAFGEDVLKNLRWVNESVGTLLKEAIHLSGPIPLKPLMVEAMRRGDECHNRHVAGNQLFINYLRPQFIRMQLQRKEMNQILEFIERNYYSFLNICLAACKATADAASHIPYSTIVTAIARNGVETGIRLSGTGHIWFTSPAPTPSGRILNPFHGEDANPDMGDSTITETVGLGAFAMGAAPEIVSYLGGSADDVIRSSKKMYEITTAEHSSFRIPQFENRGSPLGIDALSVVEKEIIPIINTGIAHKDGGIGQIGAGLVSVPMECFKAAKHEFERQYGML